MNNLSREARLEEPNFDRAIARWDKQKANFIKTLDLHLVEVGRGTATMRMPFRAAIANNAGAVHGGAIVSLCDTVFWVALASLYGPEQPTATASLSCNFLRPALPPHDLIARATVLKPGARIVYGEVHVHSGEKLVAHATLSFLNTPVGEGRAVSPGTARRAVGGDSIDSRSADAGFADGGSNDGSSGDARSAADGSADGSSAADGSADGRSEGMR